MTIQKIREQVLDLTEEERWELIDILMKSLRTKPPLAIKNRGIAASLVGIAKTDAPAPTDEEVKEDAVQVAAAMEARLDAIVTRDVAGFIGSPILVMSPEELVNQLGQ